VDGIRWGIVGGVVGGILFYVQYLESIVHLMMMMMMAVSKDHAHKDIQKHVVDVLPMTQNHLHRIVL
jgi:hypothetical protein